jgi:hypothetical protein
MEPILAHVRMLPARLRALREGIMEFALLLALIAIVAVVSLKLLGTRVTTVLHGRSQPDGRESRPSKPRLSPGRWDGW